MTKLQLFHLLSSYCERTGVRILRTPTCRDSNGGIIPVDAILVSTGGIFLVGVRMRPEPVPGETANRLIQAIQVLSDETGIPCDYFEAFPVQLSEPVNPDCELSPEEVVPRLEEAEPKILSEQLSEIETALRNLTTRPAPSDIPAAIPIAEESRQDDHPSNLRYVIGGLVTVVLLLSWALYHFSIRPKLEEKRAAEILQTCYSNMRQIETASENACVSDESYFRGDDWPSMLCGPNGYIRKVPECPLGASYRVTGGNKKTVRYYYGREIVNEEYEDIVVECPIHGRLDQFVK